MSAKRAARALELVDGEHLNKALLSGYRKAGNIVKQEAMGTTAFKKRTGTLHSSFKVSTSRKPYLHAKVQNTATSRLGRPYPLFLERKPYNSKFMENATRKTADEQLQAVKDTIIAHLRKVSAQTRGSPR